MIIVDTDILIWILRGKEEIINLFNQKVEKQNKIMYIITIQTAEIFAGLRERVKLITEKFLESFNIIDIDVEIGKLSGNFLNNFGKSTNVTLSDSMIAAAAIINEMKLWTLNKKHYPMIEDNLFEKD
ncbi:MAG: type II toxin-antitoxin system VapC family toxin [Spirochaetes bacterium]|nr:type II toxin-antitoxin system VapC family toxin [Spirochaetota bacterium]